MDPVLIRPCIPPCFAITTQLQYILVERTDELRVRFPSVAFAESRRDPLDPLAWSMLSPHPSFKFCRDGEVAQSVCF
ncbi:hypothetical protein Y032_0235g3194 [Ancylostoma ceylanicum]|uniref:Uncharacterized protein n=1 Tax=Ancylostoma ceylanicum TaxID=53326 RepID=A0A016SEP9_9BILA|nr:hypothetical protein Y032_0235g3194 [Ancylostoma ceylanicum]